MNTKLTLTIEEEVIKKAKQYAREHGRSLSEMVQNYFKALVKDGNSKELNEAPLTNALRGSFTAPDELDYKEELAKALKEKYA